MRIGARVGNWLYPAQARGKRMVCLDVLRGVAILLVLAHHAPHLRPETGWLARGIIVARRFGWSGVDLFFVLSGFLVGGLLLKELRDTGGLRPGRFLLRRGFKIWPSYYVYLACVPLFMVLYGESDWGQACRVQWVNVVHLQNYVRTDAAYVAFPGNYLTARSHTWSLAVEEHFYLVLALGLGLLAVGQAYRRRWAVPAAAVAVAGFSLALRLRLEALHPGAASVYWTCPTHLRVDGLLSGVFWAYLYYLQPAAFARFFRWWPGLLILGGLLLAPMLVWEPGLPFVHTWGFTLLYLGYGLILGSVVYAAEQVPAVRRLFALPVAGVVAFIGFYSYNIYLWHLDLAQMPVNKLLEARGWQGAGPWWWTYLILYGLAAVAAGVVLGRLVESPALALRERLVPSRAKMTATTTAVGAETVKE